MLESSYISVFICFQLSHRNCYQKTYKRFQSYLKQKKKHFCCSFSIHQSNWTGKKWKWKEKSFWASYHLGLLIKQCNHHTKLCAVSFYVSDEKSMVSNRTLCWEADVPIEADGKSTPVNQKLRVAVVLLFNPYSAWKWLSH